MSHRSHRHQKHGLSIQLKSFTLPSSIVAPNDTIRISITTIPQQQKEAFCISASEMNCSNIYFNVNISKRTEKIIVVFRKKSFFFQDPIIASTVIHQKDLPHEIGANSQINIEFPIFEPIQASNNKSHRKIIGHMQLSMSLNPAFYEAEGTRRSTSKHHNKHSTENIIPNEDEIDNMSLLDDFRTLSDLRIY